MQGCPIEHQRSRMKITSSLRRSFPLVQLQRQPLIQFPLERLALFVSVVAVENERIYPAIYHPRIAHRPPPSLEQRPPCGRLRVVALSPLLYFNGRDIPVPRPGGCTPSGRGGPRPARTTATPAGRKSGEQAPPHRPGER